MLVTAHTLERNLAKIAFQPKYLVHWFATRFRKSPPQKGFRCYLLLTKPAHLEAAAVLDELVLILESDAMTSALAKDQGS